MYYGLNSISETPKEIRPDIKDCIFRFKIAADAFSRLEDIATGQNKPLFYDKVQQKKGSLSREEVLGRILTGRAFCFLFRIEGSVNGNNVISEGMKIYVTPENYSILKSMNIEDIKRCLDVQSIPIQLIEMVLSPNGSILRLRTRYKIE